MKVGVVRGELIARAGQNTPERRAMMKLYARMADLPPRLQMLMVGCSPELEAKRHRINARQLVIRTMLAFTRGLDRVAYWNLAPEVPGRPDPYQLMHLIIGKLPLLDYAGPELRVRHPAADTFALLAEHLAGATAVRRLEGPAYAFAVERHARGPLLVAWDRRDTFDGEDEPPVTVTLPWPAPAATVVDALGRAETATVGEGRVRLSLKDTPVFVNG